MNRPEPKKGNQREAAVNGLRGLMLLIIVAIHYIPTSFFSGNIARPAAAVMLAVTGYFFMTILERSAPAADAGLSTRAASAFRIFFLRHMRIWPVIVGVVAMYVILDFADPSPITTQIHHTWPLYLGYMGNVVKMMFEGEAFPAHFWLISAQEQFVAIILVASVLTGVERLGGFLKFAVVAGVVVRVVGCALWMPDHPALATESPFAISDAIALGMLCRRAISGGESKTRLRRQVSAGILGTAVVWASIPNTYAAYFGLVPLMTALAGCLFILKMADEVRARSFERSIFTSPLLVLLGQMSLSLFLLHPLVNTVLNLTYARVSGQIIPWWMLLLVGPPMSILVAFAYFRTVEVPISRLRSNLKEPRPVRRPSDATGLLEGSGALA